MTAYYNENDPYAAKWLRELIKGGVIAEGIVDERSIEDIIPAELAGFTQCHFFAGIGIWSVALRAAGWPDNRPVWTGSCPCQPFSTAGKGKGITDERHLWPSWYWLITEYTKAFGDIGTIFGEQVASKDGIAWLDTVQSDLEAIGYAVGPLDLPAASVGAPHIRQRIYFAADAGRDESRRQRNDYEEAARLSKEEWPQHGSVVSSRNRKADSMANTYDLSRRLTDEAGRYGVDETGRSRSTSELEFTGGERRGRRHKADSQELSRPVQTEGRCSPYELGHSDDPRLQRFGWNERNGYESRRLDAQSGRSITATGAISGSWTDADWLYCRDEKFRPVERGTFPLAHGIPRHTRSIITRLCELGIDPDNSKRILKLARSNRNGRLRGYGNAIVAPLAVAFIEAYLTSGETE